MKIGIDCYVCLILSNILEEQINALKEEVSITINIKTLSTYGNFDNLAKREQAIQSTEGV